jgi:threonine/homoserine/homoserine lactone efflux protein
MSTHLYMAFVLASAIVICSPGPTVFMVIADALAHHKRHAWSTVLGVGAGDLVAMSLSLAGAGAVLRASATAFTIMKIIGGLYLVYLGVKSVVAARRRSRQLEFGSETATRSAAARFTAAFTVTVTNPKLILFFVAFVPQFIATAQSFVYQGAIYIATFDLMAMINASLYAYMARSMGRRLTNPQTQQHIGYVSGGILIAAGVLILALKYR